MANQGLAVRHADGYKYVLVDPAWKPVGRPAEALFDLAADPGERRPLAEPTARLLELRRAAQRRLRDDATGIHIEVSNPGGQELCAVLHSSLVRQNTVKVPGPWSFADWAGRGRIALSVPPGERARLILLGGGGAPVPLRLERSRCGPAFEPLEVELTPEELTAGRGWRLAGGRWQPSRPGARGSAAALSVAWVGTPVSAGEGGPATPRPEVEERLRALGYL
jgi:hypothetical protein